MKAISKMDHVMGLGEVLQAKVKYIKVCSSMIKWKGKEYTCGLMAQYLKAVGQLVKNKDQESTYSQMVKFKMEKVNWDSTNSIQICQNKSLMR